MTKKVSMMTKSFYLCFFIFFIQSIYCQKTINFIDKDGYECFGMPFPYSINSEFYLENKGLIKKYKLNYWIYVEDGTMKNQDYYAPGVGSHMIHEFQSDSTILIVFLKYTKYRYLILDKFEFLNKYISGRFFYKTSEINGIEDNQIFTLAHFNKDYLFHQYFDSICISLKADTIKKKIINLNYKNVKCFNYYYMDFPSEYDTELPEWYYNGIDGKLNNFT